MDRSCTNDNNGQCSVTSKEYEGSEAGILSFTILDLAREGYSYKPLDNRDPDGDSDGTTISVSMPQIVSMFVADLDGSTTVNGTKWSSHVTLVVMDATGQPVPSADLSASWSDGNERRLFHRCGRRMCLCQPRICGRSNGCHDLHGRTISPTTIPCTGHISPA